MTKTHAGKQRFMADGGFAGPWSQDKKTRKMLAGYRHIPLYSAQTRCDIQ
jgi:hypothetical protein